MNDYLSALALSYINTPCTLRTYATQERTRAALILLLGPDTDHATRTLAVQRLARQGPSILPLFLTILQNMPEITTPPWPEWPPQYAHCSRLLQRLCQKANISLTDIMYHPYIARQPGPTLWITVLEMLNHQPTAADETILCAGLEAEWITVRYAAAIALAIQATKTPLSPHALLCLQYHQQTAEDPQVRLAASYTLLHSEEECGLSGLLQLLTPHTSLEIRRACLFILTTKLSIPLSETHQQALEHPLLDALTASQTDIALLAARVLRTIASPAIIDTLYTMLTQQQTQTQTQIHILTALEEVAHDTQLRHYIRHTTLTTYLLTLLRSTTSELRRQAAYTLATIGGEYVLAAFGTILLDPSHPSHLDVLASLRLFHDALRSSRRATLVRWFISCTQQPVEDTQIIALDSLTHLLWRARTRGPKQVWYALSQEILQEEFLSPLLHHQSPLLRLHTIELLGMLDSSHELLIAWHQELFTLLQHDPVNDIRTNIALLCAQNMLRAALPYLIPALLDHDEQVAGAALVALERMATSHHPLITYVVGELRYYGSTQQPLIASAHALHKKLQKHQH